MFIVHNKSKSPSNGVVPGTPPSDKSPPGITWGVIQGNIGWKGAPAPISLTDGLYFNNNNNNNYLQSLHTVRRW